MRISDWSSDVCSSDLFSGVVGGRVDSVIMRAMDVVLSVPSLVLTMALAAALGPSLFNAMLAITIVRIPFYVRLARGQALSIREMAYVKAAHTFGATRRHIVSWHIVRNALSPIIVQTTLDIGNAILMAAALGFIGLGAQQPTAEWRSEEHTSELQSLMRISYAVFCLKKKKHKNNTTTITIHKLLTLIAQ